MSNSGYLRNIRLSALPLGRPSQEKRKQQCKQLKEDEAKRNEIEGVFGVAKRKFSLERIMAKLKQTSESMIAMAFFVMNIETRLRLLFCSLFFWLKWGRKISLPATNYDLTG